MTQHAFGPPFRLSRGRAELIEQGTVSTGFTATTVSASSVVVVRGTYFCGASRCRSHRVDHVEGSVAPCNRGLVLELDRFHQRIW
jgi:hypothetical protein